MMDEVKARKLVYEFPTHVMVPRRRNPILTLLTPLRQLRAKRPDAPHSIPANLLKHLPTATSLHVFRYGAGAIAEGAVSLVMTQGNFSDTKPGDVIKVLASGGWDGRRFVPQRLELKKVTRKPTTTSNTWIFSVAPLTDRELRNWLTREGIPLDTV